MVVGVWEHTDFSRGRSGGLVFPSLSEFLQFIVIHTIKGFGKVNKADQRSPIPLECGAACDVRPGSSTVLRVRALRGQLRGWRLQGARGSWGCQLQGKRLSWLLG